MESSPDTAQNLMNILTGTARRAVTIGASAASLVVWALIPGYTYYATYLYRYNATWALGMVAVPHVVLAGTMILVFLLGNLFALLFFRFTIPWADRAIRLLGITTLTLSGLLMLGVIAHIDWLKGTTLQTLFALSVILGTAGTAVTVIHTASVGPLTVPQKIAAAICLPAMSILFAGFAGLTIASGEMRRGIDALPEARINTDETSPWKVLVPLGERLLLVQGDLNGSHALRVIQTSDITQILYSGADSKPAAAASVGTASPLHAPKS